MGTVNAKLRLRLEESYVKPAFRLIYSCGCVAAVGGVLRWGGGVVVAVGGGRGGDGDGSSVGSGMASGGGFVLCVGVMMRVVLFLVMLEFGTVLISWSMVMWGFAGAWVVAAWWSGCMVWLA